jgi:NAD(P)-dependent dehydrogenase (short-subunit alcohol dehydrogenase family)
MAGLEGKVALITGAGGMKGIGRATALKLASQGGRHRADGRAARVRGSASGRGADAVAWC